MKTTSILASCILGAVLGQESAYPGGACPIPQKEQGANELAWLYKMAQHEAKINKGKRRFTVFEGGDAKNGREPIRQNFAQAFPGIDANLVVNFSNHHDKDIDAFFNNKTKPAALPFDAIRIQTVQNFPRWKKDGRLEPYKPPHFDQVPDHLKDKDGHYVANAMITFAPIVKMADYLSGNYPLEDMDFVDPKWKGKLTITYPNDDDAVLYQFYRLFKNYGKDHVRKLLIDQKPLIIRGTEGVIKEVEDNTKINATFTGGKWLVSGCSSKSVMVLPKKSEFLSWGQTMGVVKGALYPCTAKLFHGYYLSDAFQKDFWGMFPSRKDLQAKDGGFGSISQYPNSANSAQQYLEFLSSDKEKNNFRDYIKGLIGEPKGLNPFEDPRIANEEKPITQA